MTEHTPGPWTLDEHPQAGDWIVTAARSSTDDRAIGRVVTWRPEWRANARLVAAAPDLLAALRDIADDCGWVPEPRTGLERQMAERARAAIAKATEEDTR